MWRAAVLFLNFELRVSSFVLAIRCTHDVQSCADVHVELAIQRDGPEAIHSELASTSDIIISDFDR